MRLLVVYVARADWIWSATELSRGLRVATLASGPNRTGRRVRNSAATGIYIDEMPEEAIAITAHSRADAGSRADAQHAFQRAVLPERARLYALALTITRDPVEGEDIVQETMLSAWRSWARVHDPTHPGPWLTRICVNHCLQYRRKLSRLRQSGFVSEAAAPPPLHFEGQLLDFDRAFARLSAKQRAVFALHVHHGYSVDECARLTGCRPGTARSHLGRAIATLRKEMSNA